MTKRYRGYDSRLFTNKFLTRVVNSPGRYAFSKPDDLPQLKLASHLFKAHKGTEDTSCNACKELKAKL